MEFLFVLVFFGSVVGVITWFERQKRFAVRLAWEQAARELNLTFDSSRCDLTGTVGQLIVRVERDTVDKKLIARIRVDGQGSIPAGIKLRTESLTSGFSKLISGPELQIGDPQFDARVYFESGDEALLRAVFDAHCREQLMRVFANTRNPSLASGVFSCECGEPAEASELIRSVRQAVALGQALCIKRAEVPGRLLAIVQSNDRVEVRLPALDVLLRSYRDEEAVHAGLLTVLSDPEPSVRKAVAIKLIPWDLDALLLLAASEIDPEVLVALLSHLADYTQQRLWPTIRHALGSRNSAVVKAAADAARATKYTALAPRLARRLERKLKKGEPALLVSLAQALGALSDPSTEPTLIGALAHDDRAPQIAAAEALGELGSVRAVEPLLALADRHAFGGASKHAALAAVARIQSRLGQEAIGGLTLADPIDPIGALSLAESAPPAGALSKIDGSRR
jgi:HEAT repeat protein